MKKLIIGIVAVAAVAIIGNVFLSDSVKKDDVKVAYDPGTGGLYKVASDPGTGGL
jgi:hypothetical protein